MSNFECNLFKNGGVEIMSDDEKTELKEIVAEISRISRIIESNMSFPRWKLKLHFAMIKELVWQAENIVGKKQSDRFEDSKGDDIANSF